LSGSNARARHAQSRDKTADAVAEWPLLINLERSMQLESQVTGTNLSLDTIVLFTSDMAASRTFYERTLGLRPLATYAANPYVAMYAAGHVHICLLAAAEHGISLPSKPDRSADITFMVDDFSRCREVLETRGVRFSRTLEYSIGTTADFYDPDGHWFSIYQPSETAMGWPSGPKLQALASGLPLQRFKPAGAASGAGDLGDAFIAYVFLFYNDPDVAERFYSGVLELEAIEGGPCRRIATRAPIGVVKYDVGTTLLTTHHVEIEDKRFQVSTTGSDGVAFAFRVTDLNRAVSALSRRGVNFCGWPSRSHIGRLERFMDPTGHVLLLRESMQEDEASVLTVPAQAATYN
jgi:catechol 2,3-dioxygenase-like lactoylglutathione lyase family enzyme